MSAIKMDAVVKKKKCGTADGGVHFPVGLRVITVKAFFQYLSTADICGLRKSNQYNLNGGS